MTTANLTERFSQMYREGNFLFNTINREDFVQYLTYLLAALVLIGAVVFISKIIQLVRKVLKK